MLGEAGFHCMWSSLFKRIESTRGQIGVLQSSDGLAVAQVLSPLHVGKHRPELVHCSFDTSDSDSLSRVTKQLSNRKQPAVAVLPTDAYHMLLVEAPDVPEDELRAAVRWRIKDLIDFHIDDAVIDVFQMPQQSRGGPNQMMYAIAARADGVRSQVSAAEAAGLNLAVIDILELSLRNVASLLEEGAEGLALLYLSEASSLLLLVRQGVLYLARHIETGESALRNAGSMRAELIAGLALEARRSLDYFESHYEQSPISALYTSGLTAMDREQLGRDLGISIREIEPFALFETRLSLSPELQRKCLPAIGAALRRDKLTL